MTNYGMVIIAVLEFKTGHLQLIPSRYWIIIQHL